MKTDSLGRVTIAIPVYNGGKYLDVAIESALAQTYRDIEIVVFDNASTDDTAEIAQAYRDSVRIVDAKVNRGAAWNFNRAVAATETPFFMWLAADDRLRPTYVEKCVNSLVQNPAAQFALSDIEYIDPEGLYVYETREDGFLASTDVRLRLRSYLNRRRWTEVYSMYWTENLLATALFRPMLGADVLLVWELLLRGPAALVPEPLLVYRQYDVKTSQGMAESVTADPAWPRWPKVHLWLELWRVVGCAQVERETRWTARRELLHALRGRTWVLRHLFGDFRSEAARPGASAGIRWGHLALAFMTKIGLRVRRGLRFGSPPRSSRSLGRGKRHPERP